MVRKIFTQKFQHRCPSPLMSAWNGGLNGNFRINEKEVQNSIGGKENCNANVKNMVPEQAFGAMKKASYFKGLKKKPLKYDDNEGKGPGEYFFLQFVSYSFFSILNFLQGRNSTITILLFTEKKKIQAFLVSLVVSHPHLSCFLEIQIPHMMVLLEEGN